MNGGALIKFSNSKERHIYMYVSKGNGKWNIIDEKCSIESFFDDERRVEINMSIENCRQLGSQLELKFDYN